MRVIVGEKVDLITPFPRSQIHRLYHWLRSYKTSVFVDGSPNTLEDFVPYMEKIIDTVVSYGIIDKYNSIQVNHKAPIVGCIMFELQVHNAYAHITSSRKSWGKPNPETKQRDIVSGMTYEGAKMAIQDLFDNHPSLLRISAAILPWNKAARLFAEKVGMSYEGRMPHMALQNGKPIDIVHYGLTRQTWENKPSEGGGEEENASSSNQDNLVGST